MSCPRPCPSKKSGNPASKIATTTPIKYVVVICQENHTFDNYFGTYPLAQNNVGETQFKARHNTPKVNGFTPGLLINNQNFDNTNTRVNPFRIAPALSTSFSATFAGLQNSYIRYQQAMDCGLMDKFVKAAQAVGGNNNSMAYFDGNTVTALWNYAQYFTLADNFYCTIASGSTVGALNLICGQTTGATATTTPVTNLVPSVGSSFETIVNDVDPSGDRSDTGSFTQVIMQGTSNVGDLLNSRGIPWGWFNGGFSDSKQSHVGANGALTLDYVPHHQPFQYFPSTANLNHLPPASLSEVGSAGPANHQYDYNYLFPAAENGNLPSVSFIKAPAYQDGHPNYSSPLMEQPFIVDTINRLQKLPEWKEMAIFIAWDDAGGWYDHQMPPNSNQSQSTVDALTGVDQAGTNEPFGNYQGRFGFGLRLPLIAISPWAKENFVDSSILDHSSIVRFIEENWTLGQIGNFSFDALSGSVSSMFDFKCYNPRKLFLDTVDGTVKKLKRCQCSKCK
ncbi:MAG: phospholipase [Sylvanvirus sp.]|uniref:Phospholipase n=1 Tax=Sylvanvirus sp. TaxID=2487774 RepID=A0A3G5AKF2_9VIRU|nr:MAG: phospholipase [Sylvanvirus sp.]